MKADWPVCTVTHSLEFGGDCVHVCAATESTGLTRRGGGGRSFLSLERLTKEGGGGGGGGICLC